MLDPATKKLAAVLIRTDKIAQEAFVAVRQLYSKASDDLSEMQRKCDHEGGHAWNKIVDGKPQEGSVCMDCGHDYGP